jgi:hypothetical protein
MSRFSNEITEGIVIDYAGVDPDVTGFIGARLFPFETMAVETGTIRYVPNITEGTAVTTRADGAEPTRTSLASGTYSYTAGDVSDGFLMSEEEILNIGGYSNAEQFGLESAYVSVYAKHEALVKAEVWACGVAASGSTVDAQIQNAMYKTRDVRGEYALILGQSARTALFADASMLARLTGVQAAIPEAGQAAEISLLKAVYGFEVVLVGDDTYWTDADNAAVVKLPSKDRMSYKRRAETGKTFIFGDEKPELRIIDKPYSVAFDGVTKMDIATLNSAGMCLVDLT